jgi:hypothetical protein
VPYSLQDVTYATLKAFVLAGSEQTEPAGKKGNVE